MQYSVRKQHIILFNKRQDCEIGRGKTISRLKKGENLRNKHWSQSAWILPHSIVSPSTSRVKSHLRINTTAVGITQGARV